MAVWGQPPTGQRQRSRLPSPGQSQPSPRALIQARIVWASLCCKGCLRFGRHLIIPIPAGLCRCNHSGRPTPSSQPRARKSLPSPPPPSASCSTGACSHSPRWTSCLPNSSLSSGSLLPLPPALGDSEVWLSSWAESPKKDVTGTAQCACECMCVPCAPQASVCRSQGCRPLAACFPARRSSPLSARPASSLPPSLPRLCLPFHPVRPQV